MLEWEARKPYGNKIHVWENQHGEELYVKSKLSGYDVALTTENRGRFQWLRTHHYGSFENEHEAVDHAVETIMGETINE